MGSEVCCPKQKRTLNLNGSLEGHPRDRGGAFVYFHYMWNSAIQPLSRLRLPRLTNERKRVVPVVQKSLALGLVQAAAPLECSMWGGGCRGYVSLGYKGAKAD